MAEQKVRVAADVHGAEGLHEGAGDVSALGDLIVVVAVASPRLVRDQIKDAAREFERASRARVTAPWRGSRAGSTGSRHRSCRSRLLPSAATTRRPRSGSCWSWCRPWRPPAGGTRRRSTGHRPRRLDGPGGFCARRSRSPPARARPVSTGPAPSGPERGRWPGSARRPHRVNGRWPVWSRRLCPSTPEHARAVLADPAWPALRTRLAEVERVGEDVVDVLVAVAGRRELFSAESVAEVLTWRLDGWRKQRGKAAAAPGTSSSSTVGGGTGRSTGSTTGRSAAPAAKRRPPGDEQGTGPRRTR